MGWNGSGTYLLPAGQPVAVGTTITAAAFNTFTTDLQGVLGNCLTRDGQGPMNVPLAIQSGTVTAPGLTFGADTATGIFRPVASTLSITLLGVEQLRFQTAGIQTLNNVIVNGYLQSTGNMVTIGNVLASGSVSAANSGAGIGGDRIINGDFAVAQRGVSSAVAGYWLDRWFCNQTGTVGTQFQGSAGVIAGLGTVRAFWGLNGIAGNTGVNLLQRIEAANCADLVGQSITFSYWVFQNTGSTVNVSTAFYFATAANNFTGLSNASITQAGTTAVPTAVWTKVTGTAVLPTVAVNANAANGLEIVLWNQGTAIVASQVLYIANVKLEIGSVATTYQPRPIQQELALCQRYFQRWQQPPLKGVCQTTTSMSRLGMALAVPMRVAPTATVNGSLPIFDGTLTGTITVFGTNYNTTNVFEADATLASGALSAAGRPAIVYQTGTASLDLSAEI